MDDLRGWPGRAFSPTGKPGICRHPHDPGLALRRPPLRPTKRSLEGASNWNVSMRVIFISPKDNAAVRL